MPVAAGTQVTWLATPVATRIRPEPATAVRTGVLAAMLANRARGYTSLGFPDPRRTALTPSASMNSYPAKESRAVSGDVPGPRWLEIDQ